MQSWSDAPGVFRTSDHWEVSGANDHGEMRLVWLGNWLNASKTSGPTTPGVLLRQLQAELLLRAQQSSEISG
jgi:hypothetical protein